MLCYICTARVHLQASCRGSEHQDGVLMTLFARVEVTLKSQTLANIPSTSKLDDYRDSVVAGSMGGVSGRSLYAHVVEQSLVQVLAVFLLHCNFQALGCGVCREVFLCDLMSGILHNGSLCVPVTEIGRTTSEYVRGDGESGCK